MKSCKKTEIKRALGCLLLMGLFLFVSCENKTAEPIGDCLASIEFAVPTSRDLSVNCTPENYDDLYWFYTATKKDKYGNSGATEKETRVNESAGLEGELEGFSAGEWEFKLFAYTAFENGTLVYKTSDENKNVYLKAGAATAITVSVIPASEKGVLSFSNVTANTSVTKLEVYKQNTVAEESGFSETPIYTFGTDTEIKIERDSSTSKIVGKKTDIEAGTYRCEAKTETGVIVSTFYFMVYGNATTSISGSLDAVSTVVNPENAEADSSTAVTP